MDTPPIMPEQREPERPYGGRFRRLDEAQIDQTLRRLRDRILERFPESGLGQLSGELVDLAEDSFTCIAYLQRPNWLIRFVVGVVIAGMATIIGVGIGTIHLSGGVDRWPDLAQALEASVNDLVFLSVAIYFLITVESRLKRRRALRSLNALRSVVHIVDMHQLTKDPERLMSPRSDTASSPERSMTPPELGRYLDYCSELLSLTSKVAALFVQQFHDPLVMSTVNEIETLVTGLSGKIWQKITLLERVARDSSRDMSIL